MIDRNQLREHVESVHVVEQRQHEFEELVRRFDGSETLQRVSILLDGRLRDLRTCHATELYLIRHLARIAYLDAINNIVQRKIDNEPCNGR